MSVGCTTVETVAVTDVEKMAFTDIEKVAFADRAEHELRVAQTTD
jgi:hypothetical protein